MRTALAAIHWNCNEHLEAIGYRFVERMKPKMSKIHNAHVLTCCKTQVKFTWKMEINDLSAAATREQPPLQQNADDFDDFAMRATDAALEVERAEWDEPEDSSEEEFYYFSDEE